MDVSPLTVLIGAVVVAVVGYAGIRYQAKRTSSGGIKETAADRLWQASETMRTDLTTEVQRLRGEVLTYRSEQLAARAEEIEAKRASRVEIEALTARVKDLEGQLTAALAEVKELRMRLGEPTVP